MNIKIVIILIIIVIFIVAFKYIEPLFSKHKIKNSNEYGSARFSTFNEINKIEGFKARGKEYFVSG